MEEDKSDEGKCSDFGVFRKKCHSIIKYNKPLFSHAN